MNRKIITEEWDTKNVNNLFTLGRKNFIPSSCPQEMFAHFSIPAFDKNAEPKLVKGRDIESNKFLIEKDSILISKLNPRKKRVWLVDSSVRYKNLRSVCSTEFIQLIPRNSDIHLKFYYYYFGADFFYREIKRKAMGTTNSRQRMSPEEILDFEISELPIEEQRRIASILENIDNTIDETQELIEKYKKLKDGLMHDLFSECLEERNTISFSDKKYVKLITKGTTPTTYGYSFVDHGINFVKVEAIDDFGHFITDQFQHITTQAHNHLRRSQLREDDVLLSIAGALGRCIKVTKNILPANINQALALIRFENYIDVEYVKYTLDSFIIQDLIKKISVQLAQANLNLGDIKKFRIPYPEPEKRENIVATLKSIDNAIDSERFYLNKLVRIKTGLMHDLLTGKVRVGVAG